MRRALAVLLALAAAPGLASDLPPPDPVTAEGCAVDWQAPAEVTGLVAKAAARAEDGWCRRGEAALATGVRSGLAAETIRWRGVGLGRFADAGLTPIALELEARKVFLTTAFSSPAQSYLLTEQSRIRAFDLAIAAYWDAGAERLTLASFTLDYAQSGAPDH